MEKKTFWSCIRLPQGFLLNEQGCEGVEINSHKWNSIAEKVVHSEIVAHGYYIRVGVGSIATSFEKMLQ